MLHNERNRSLILAMLLLLLPLGVYAGPGFPGDDNNPGGEVGTPIDGGATMLVAAAAAYGYRRLRKKKQEEK